MENDQDTSGSPPMPKDKAELLARIRRSRAALEQTIGGLSDAQLTAPVGDDGWSIKDHLAHVVAWEQSLLALLAGRDRDAAIGLGGAPDGEHNTDDLNALLYARHKDRPLPEVLVDSRQSHERVLAALGGLSDADLFKPYSHYQPDDPPYNPDPVIGWIAGNTYEHYQEHQGWIEALIARQRQS